MTTWPLIGNARAVRALQTAAAAGAQHAFLLAGPERTGRAAAARILAQYLNCTAEPRPCGECSQCRRIAQGIHADVQTLAIEETAAASRKSISVEQVREMEAAVALNPYEGRTRVVVIDPAEALSDAAQAAFLKTLEEPPPNVVFVLIAQNPDHLTDPVRSRCARVDFSLVPAAEIEAALLERGTPPGDALLLTRLAAGRPGWALAATSDTRALEHRREALAQARELPAMPLADRMDLAERLSNSFKNDRAPVLRLLDEWRGWWRDVLLVQTGAEDGVANVDHVSELREDAARLDQTAVTAFVQAFLETRENLRLNVQSRIALDALMLSVPQLHAAHPAPAH